MDLQFTDAAVRKYLHSGASRCPACGDTDISGGSSEFDGLESWRDVECEACGATWREVFKMVGVMEAL